jgi:hypothetical protein
MPALVRHYQLGIEHQLGELGERFRDLGESISKGAAPPRGQVDLACVVSRECAKAISFELKQPTRCVERSTADSGEA